MEVGVAEKKRMTETQQQNGNGKRTRCVLPQQLDAETRKLLDQTLSPVNVSKAFEQVFTRVEDASDVLEYVSLFLEKYESQVLKVSGEKLGNQQSAVRGALLCRTLELMAAYRRSLAELGFNPVFLQTFLRKRLLATLLGITTQDVDFKIRVSGRKPPLYIEEQLDRLIPHTFLKPWHRAVLRRVA